MHKPLFVCNIEQDFTDLVQMEVKVYLTKFAPYYSP